MYMHGKPSSNLLASNCLLKQFALVSHMIAMCVTYSVSNSGCVDVHTKTGLEPDVWLWVAPRSVIGSLLRAFHEKLLQGSDK